MDIPVRTEGLTKRYGRVRALTNVRFETPPGAVFALIGANGAGKTTAIKTILNIMPPTAGRAEVLGADSRHLGPAEFARIGYVSENQEFPEWMTVARWLAFTREFYPQWDDNDAAELVRRLELPLNRPLRALSRGMKVKAALAASLPYRPELIVLDEPFSGLDGLVREQVIESLIERMDNSTVLIASHDLAEIENCATHVAYLSEGRLVFTEEIGSLTGRFRDIEVTCDANAVLPPDLPAAWLNVQRSGTVLRFVDSQFAQSGQEAVARIPGVRNLSARAMTLRAIFVALERSRKREVAQ
jgi:ABC-2 type transport system ATP-binding protein